MDKEMVAALKRARKALKLRKFPANKETASRRIGSPSDPICMLYREAYNRLYGVLDSGPRLQKKLKEKLRELEEALTRMHLALSAFTSPRLYKLSVLTSGTTADIFNRARQSWEEARERALVAIGELLREV